MMDVELEVWLHLNFLNFYCYFGRAIWQNTQRCFLSSFLSSSLGTIDASVSKYFLKQRYLSLLKQKLFMKPIYFWKEPR